MNQEDPDMTERKRQLAQLGNAIAAAIEEAAQACLRAAEQMADAIETAWLRMRWRKDRKTGCLIRGQSLIEYEGGVYWLRLVTGQDGYTVTRHLGFSTLLAALQEERTRT